MDAKRVVRIDAAFEDALGTTLVVWAIAGASGFPIGRGLVAALGAVLLLAAAVLWRGRMPLAPLAAANAVTAVAAIAWLALDSFSRGAAAVVLVTVVALLVLAALQVATLRRWRATAT
jgi:hypothetical protein